MFCIYIVAKAQAYTVNTPAQVEDYIIRSAQMEGVDVGMAVGIAKAESGFVANAHNPVGTASGVFQFLNSTFFNYCINKYHLTDTMADKDIPTMQIRCAMQMLKEPYGWHHWNASYPMWGYLLSRNG